VDEIHQKEEMRLNWIQS